MSISVTKAHHKKRKKVCKNYVVLYRLYKNFEIYIKEFGSPVLTEKYHFTILFLHIETFIVGILVY